MDKLLDIKKLKAREKVLLGVFTVAVGLVVYTQIIHKPLSQKISRFDFQRKKFELKLSDLEVSLPRIEEQKARSRALRAQGEGLLSQIDKIEKNLPSKRNVSQLLGEFARLAQNVKLISIRQKMETGDEYSRIFVELRFNASYEGAIEYISKIESISPFLAIEELNIAESKDKKEKNGPVVRMMVSTLLGEVPFVEQFKAIEAREKVKVSRDIFISKAKPVPALRKVELKLEGITYSPRGSTAIINGEVVRPDSKIGDYKVKQILPDAVILANGSQEHILSVEK